MRDEDFKKTLAQGHKYEQLALKYILHDEHKMMDGCFSEYDMVLTYEGEESKIEVKSDNMSHKTKNIVIEYESNKKPSGISITKADAWVYFSVEYDKGDEVKATVYYFPIRKLKKLIKNCRQLTGGYNKLSKMYILPMRLCEKFIIEPW